jgi:L-ectoine synthase
MFYTSVQAIVGTRRDVRGDGWKSRRMILAEDGLPFSVHETIVVAGTELRFCYEKHSETVYCIEGEGTIEDMARGTISPLRPGALYSAAIGDDHVLRADADLKLLCIFEPALKGAESAD